MKKKIKKLFVMILLMTFILSPIENYLVHAQSNNNSFFEIENVEVTKDEEITMKINLDQIEYENFNFKLESNLSLLNVEVDENIDENVENLNQNSSIFSFDFSKENSNLNSIVLNYSIPEDVENLDQITFKAIITSTKDEDEVLESTYTVSIIEKESEDTNTDSEDKNSSDEKTQDDNEKSNENLDKSKEKEANEKANNQTEEKNANKSQNSMSKTSVSRTSATSSSNTKKVQVTYNGSDNNYLSSLTVNDYSLNKEFKKESLTYFVSVDSDVTLLNISAVAENSNSKVYINGNSDFKTGVNKVLITVVAENGNTKNYRIYVTKA